MSWAAALPESVGGDCRAIMTVVVPARCGCDLSCPFCYIQQRSEEATVRDLTPLDYSRFISDVSGLGHVCIQGYEPLLPDSFPYTQQILETGQRLGIPTSLVTNGTHLRQHVPALSKLRPARIAVSLDSAEAAVHDKARGQGRRV